MCRQSPTPVSSGHTRYRDIFRSGRERVFTAPLVVVAHRLGFIRCSPDFRACGCTEVAVHHYITVGNRFGSGVGIIALASSPDIPAPEYSAIGIIRGEQDISDHESGRCREAGHACLRIVGDTFKGHRTHVHITICSLRGVVPHEPYGSRGYFKVCRSVAPGYLRTIRLRPCERPFHAVALYSGIEGVCSRRVRDDIGVRSPVCTQVHREGILRSDGQLLRSDMVHLAGLKSCRRRGLCRHRIVLAVDFRSYRELLVRMSGIDKETERSRAAGHHITAACKGNGIGRVLDRDGSCPDIDRRTIPDSQRLSLIRTAEYKLIHDCCQGCGNLHIHYCKEMGEFQGDRLIQPAIGSTGDAFRNCIHKIQGGKSGIRIGRIGRLLRRQGHRDSLRRNVPP